MQWTTTNAHELTRIKLLLVRVCRLEGGTLPGDEREGCAGRSIGLFNGSRLLAARSRRSLGFGIWCLGFLGSPHALTLPHSTLLRLLCLLRLFNLLHEFRRVFLDRKSTRLNSS